jgi:hypothetical protein
MKYKDYLTVNIKIQELLQLQFPTFETDEKSSIEVTDFFQKLYLSKEVVKKIKVISQYKLETKDKEKLSEFMHNFISSSLDKILQNLIINEDISLFSDMYVHFSRSFIHDDDCYNYELETLAISNSKCIMKRNNFHKRDLIFIKFYINQFFYAMVNYLSNLLSRLNNRENWDLNDYPYKRIHECVHSSKYHLLTDVVYRNIEWFKHCARIGIINCNDKFRHHGTYFIGNLKLNFLIYDIPLRLDFYQERISKELYPDDADLLAFIVQTKTHDGFYQSDINLLEYLKQKYSHSSFYQYLSEKKLIEFLSSDSLTKEKLLKHFIEYLIEKGFSPFYFNAAGILAENYSQLGCYEHLIASGFDIFETDHFGFNLISLFIRYHGNSAAITIVNLLIICATFPEILARVFQPCITIFPLDFGFEEYEESISWASYPKAMLNRDGRFINGVPYSTLLDLALLHCRTDMIFFLIMLGLKLGNTTRQKLHDEMNSLEHNGDDYHQEFFLKASEHTEKKILNLPSIYNYLTNEAGIKYCKFKTFCAFVFLTRLPILDEQKKVDIASKLLNFDADEAFDIFSRFLIARNKQISIKTGQEVFEDAPCQLPIEIIDIIVNQMLSDDYWYLPFVIVKIANEFLSTEQQSLGLLQGPAA